MAGCDSIWSTKGRYRLSSGPLTIPPHHLLCSQQTCSSSWTASLGLPKSLINNPENLITQAASGYGGAFVVLHIGQCHFSQLLRFQYLHQSVTFDTSSSPHCAETHLYADRCRESSVALCKLLYAAQALPGAGVYVS